ncbi:gliding motility protein GldM [Antarcticibacterium arcticum]|uniref:Gliding motility protein GldM n=1 Tax=Antarcticibacterium arcticum TaxID=2585771 RepID=A0A5B8YJB5_9FLAO|nr:gliding motility protein GldM [Antarcticibacterium arcticum]QED38030.1 gliding motility protein GldM [Antarcticibacterium arcticum]
MASGKQSPRQKMINLMYLVFIAMLALNMSKEVLTAFGLLNEKLTESNQTTTQRNAAFMAGLDAKVEEQPAKYAPLKEKAVRVDELSTNFNNYIETLKADLTAKQDDLQDYETMDRSDQLDEMFFTGGKNTVKGDEFMQQITAYREGVVDLIKNEQGLESIASKVQNEFATEPVEDRAGITKPWLEYHYQGYPLIASLTKLTQLQADVKNTQGEILSAMLSGQLQSEVSLTNYEAIVIPNKTAFFSGENFQGRVVLGRVDNTLQFDKVTINGKEVSSARAGQIDLNFPAGNVGEQEIKGELQFKEGDSIISIPINSSYAVIPKPNAAVISADKMNVVYRGVQNPMTISIPGVGQVSASGPGLSPAGGAGKYNMNVTTVQAREVTISVTGQLPGGEKVSDSKVFRIKDIPAPMGTIRGEDGSVKMQRNSLEISSVGASLPDFDFDLGLRVTGFSFKVSGQPTVTVRGNTLDAAAKAALRRAGRGETVQIFDIQASLANNSSYMLKKVSPVFVELTN